MLTKNTARKEIASFLKMFALVAGLPILTVFAVIFLGSRDMARPVPFDIPVFGTLVEKIGPPWVADALNDRSLHTLYDYDWASNDDPIILVNRHIANSAISHDVYLQLSSPVVFSVKGRIIRKADDTAKRSNDADMSEYSIGNTVYRYDTTILEGYKILKESQDGKHFLVMLPGEIATNGPVVLYVTRGEMLNIVRAFSYYQKSFEEVRKRHDHFVAQDKAKIEQDIKTMR